MKLNSFAVLLLCGLLGYPIVSTSQLLRNKCETGELIFKKTGDCYAYGVQGPCHDSMVTNIDTSAGSDESIGKCFCKNDAPIVCASRPKLYFPARQQCYNIYSRGPCRKGEWFVEIEAEKWPPEGVCQPNICKNITTRQPKSDAVFAYAHEGKCYQTSTRGHCEDTGEVAYFTSTTDVLCGLPKYFQEPCEQPHPIRARRDTNGQLPTTQKPKPVREFVSVVGSLSCPQGQVKNGAGKCSASAQIR